MDVKLDSEGICLGLDPRLDSRYLSTEPHFPFVVSISNFNWTINIERWLLNTGKNHEDWEWWYDGEWKFEFKNEEDKVRFILQWV